MHEANVLGVGVGVLMIVYGFGLQLAAIGDTAGGVVTAVCGVFLIAGAVVSDLWSRRRKGTLDE